MSKSRKTPPSDSKGRRWSNWDGKKATIGDSKSDIDKHRKAAEIVPKPKGDGGKKRK